MRGMALIITIATLIAAALIITPVRPHAKGDTVSGPRRLDLLISNTPAGPDRPSALSLLSLRNEQYRLTWVGPVEELLRYLADIRPRSFDRDVRFQRPGRDHAD